jgi:porin
MKNKKWFCGLAALLLLPFSVRAGGDDMVLAPSVVPEKKSEQIWKEWWNGKYIDGDWGGYREKLENMGINLSGSWLGNGYLQSGGTGNNKFASDSFDQQLKIKLQIDFEKLADWQGWSLDAMVRYRDGVDPGAYAGTSSMFDPSNYEGGKEWRLMPVYVTWRSEDLLWTKDALTVRAGWMNPWDFFIQQDNALFFINNALNSARGIGGNIPWSSSFSGWGGMIKIKPVEQTYLQVGVFETNNNATKTSVVYNGENVAAHGLPFQGDPYGLDGVEFMAEAGWTPKFGDDKLEGKYAIGINYWGFTNKGYLPSTSDNMFDNKMNYYMTIDQMLFREDNTVGKDGKMNDDGLYFCGMANYANDQNNLFPFYFQAGLLYKGLLPTRDKDKIGIMYGYGEYSQDQFDTEAANGNTRPPTDESVLEVDYRFQVSGWAYLQPFYQWIHTPGGTGKVQDDNVFGAQLNVTF